MKWRLSGFSQVVQIRAPVSAAELRFPPAGTSQQTSTSIISLMDLIRAGAASPGLGAEGGSGGSELPSPVGRRPGRGGRSPRRYPAFPATCPGSRLQAKSVSIRLFPANETSPWPRHGRTNPRLPRPDLSTLSPPSSEHPRPCGLRRVPGQRQRLSAEPGSPRRGPAPEHAPEPGLWKRREGASAKLRKRKASRPHLCTRGQGRREEMFPLQLGENIKKKKRKRGGKKGKPG